MLNIILSSIAIPISFIALWLSWQAIKETRKDRYLNQIPRLRVFEMSRKQNEKTAEWYRLNSPQEFERNRDYIEKNKEHFYILYKNEGLGIASVKSIILWVGNPGLDKKIELDAIHFKKTLFYRDEDEVAYWDATSPEGINLLMYPQKVEIIYYDRWKHKILYVATRRGEVVKESLPYLGIKDYIDHRYTLDERLN